MRLKKKYVYTSMGMLAFVANYCYNFSAHKLSIHYHLLEIDCYNAK